MRTDAVGLRALLAELAAQQARITRETQALAALAEREPLDDVALWAAGGHLQAWYTGAETALLRIFERFEGRPPASPDFHVRIVQLAGLEISGVRPAILSPETVAALNGFRAFRHFFRNAYGVDLDPVRVRRLLDTLRGTAASWDADLTCFTEVVEEIAAQQGA